MRIARIECFGLEAAVTQPFGFSQGWVTKRRAVLVRLETADGQEGWGELFCQAPPVVYTTLIAELLAPRVLGANPWDREVLWQQLYNATLDCGQRGMVVAALSGLDLALWDLAGRDSGQPVHRLLGGLSRPVAPAYATGLYAQPDDAGFTALVAEARRHVAAGFHTIKMKVGFGLARDAAAVQAVREAIGPDVSLAIDANHAYRPAQAIALGRRLAPLGIAWFEEPVSPDDPKGYADVRARQPIPVAGGELHATRFAFEQLLAHRGVDILQPDLGLCGGLSEARAIADLARLANVACWAHVWGTPVAQSAALHFLGWLPTALAAEDLAPPLVEWDCTENPLRDELAQNPPCVEGGMVAVPTAPGLGVTIDRAALARFQVAYAAVGPAASVPPAGAGGGGIGAGG